MTATDRPLLPAATLMDELEATGVRFALDGAGQPVARARRGALTAEQRAALMEHRAGIGELLAIVGAECWAPTARTNERTDR